MKTIHFNTIKDAVKHLCIEANYYLGDDVKDVIIGAMEGETSPGGKAILEQLILNADIAKQEQMAICQDTGMAVFFVRLGQNIHIEGGGLTDAINEGVRQGYREGYLRNSVVADPIRRGNTGDNTPAVIHYDITEGEELEILIAPKGFGSENMSALKMLKPSDGLDGVVEFVLDTVKKAGPNPCPPIVVGIGLGGTMEKCAQLSKKASTRNLDEYHPDPFYRELEKSLLEKVNQIGIGPQGFGGKTTALKVNIETFPTHIAGLPCSVNINCHVTRHKKVIL